MGRPRANWGANERPRYCPHCKIQDGAERHASTVTSTIPMVAPPRVSRRRKCKKCGLIFATIELDNPETATP